MSFTILLARNFQPVDISKFNTIRNLFLNDMIIRNERIYDGHVPGKSK